MSIWVLILLCIVQGVTEFLPVSSSGHLLFVEQLFGITENLMILNLFLHVATLLAVVVVYRKIIWNLLKKPFQPYTYKLIIATLCSVLLAFGYKFSGVDSIVTKIYPFGFLITSILLFACHKVQRHNIGFSENEISYKNSVVDVTVGKTEAVFELISGNEMNFAVFNNKVKLDSKNKVYKYLI